jgi:hypothetical protein
MDNEKGQNTFEVYVMTDGKISKRYKIGLAVCFILFLISLSILIFTAIKEVMSLKLFAVIIIACSLTVISFQAMLDYLKDIILDCEVEEVSIENNKVNFRNHGLKFSLSEIKSLKLEKESFKKYFIVEVENMTPIKICASESEWLIKYICRKTGIQNPDSDKTRDD